MKTENSASISIFASGIRLAALLLLLLVPLAAQEGDGAVIQSVVVEYAFPARQTHEFDILVTVKSGERYNPRTVRRTMENLFKTDLFSDVEVRLNKTGDGKADLHFVLTRRLRVKSIEIDSVGVRTARLREALFALRKNDVYDTQKQAKAEQELLEYLKKHGFFQPLVRTVTAVDRERSTIQVRFQVEAGPQTRIRSLKLFVDEPSMEEEIAGIYSGLVHYETEIFAKLDERCRALLKKRHFYFPEITLQEQFTAESRHEVDLQLHIACGFRYEFVFNGMSPRMGLIQRVWESKVFENWALDESTTRLRHALRNEGHLNVSIDSRIEVEGRVKRIVYNVNKGQRYALGKITFNGNQAVSTDELLRIIRVDDLFFDRYFWVRIDSLLVDLEMIRLYYTFQGFGNVRFDIQTNYSNRKANITLTITEGKRFTVAGIDFAGNDHFPAPVLAGVMKINAGDPFVQRRLDEAVTRLQDFYQDNGFAEAEFATEISTEDAKMIHIRIKEGPLKRMGDFLIIGASRAQENLLRRLMPLRKGLPFNRRRLEQFQLEVDLSAIFHEIRIDRLDKDAETVDVLITVIPDRNRFYGFGVGWEEGRKERGTVEYQEKNIFGTVSSVSAIVQLGFKERRGILVYDWPYFFGRKFNASFKVWQETEIYPSFEFDRWGVGVSVVKNFSERLHLIGALRWYRTSLISLDVPATDVDKLRQPFDTTALSFSFVRENRDDPFNPSKGDLISSDLKIGLPFSNNYTFLKLFWNYQKHYPLARNSVFSFSVRNGLGFGDMSIAERFFAGGSHSFRGTTIDRLGPYDPASDLPVGGNVLMIFNLETTFPFPLFPVRDLYYYLFVDIGNVFAKSTDFNFTKLQTALGIGLKYRTPLGPLRLDMAYNPSPNAKPHLRFFIGIGNAF